MLLYSFSRLSSYIKILPNANQSPMLGIYIISKCFQPLNNSARNVFVHNVLPYLELIPLETPKQKMLLLKSLPKGCTYLYNSLILQIRVRPIKGYLLASDKGAIRGP